MREDIIKLVESQGDVTNAIILTHNIDFVFLQLIVIPALKKCGRPTLTVFADAYCAANTFAYQSPVLSTIGTRYRVVPVAMESGFHFHPKAVLLSGPEKATLLIGSGNLTFGGWRENAEVWIRFESDKDTTAAFAAFRNYLLEILRRIPLSGPIKDEIDEAFDGRSRSWAEKMDAPSGLLGRVGRGQAILEQIAIAAGEGFVERLVVCSPYFDAKAKALSDLFGQLKPAKADVLVQQKYPGLPHAAVAGLPSEVEIIPVKFTRKNSKGVDRESFIHAKFYGISNADRTLVIAGSGNCSRAALTISGINGNAELLALQSLSTAQFNELYLAEMPRVEEKPDFPVLQDDEDTDAAAESLRILAARYDGSLLQIGYSCAKDMELTRCWVDGEPLLFTVEENGIIVVEVARPPARLFLEGMHNGQSIRSPEGWVDVERELRSTSRGRSLAGVIFDRVQANLWGIGAWKDVLDVFCKYLQYMPSRSSRSGHIATQRHVKHTANFTADDVFSSGYGLPNLGSAVRAGLADDRIHSLQQMLLQWFGIADHDEPPIEDQPTDEDDDGAEDTVDRPEKVLTRKKVITDPKPISEIDRKKAKKAVEQMTKAMTSEEFLSQRSPELMAADLKIAAILLRTGFKQSWIDESDFFEATRIIWSSLFFSSPKEPNRGWIERRYREAENPEQFIFKMASPELSAALAAWSMTAPPNILTPEHIVFFLANVLAVARLPWLWLGGHPGQIGKELGSMLANTGGMPSDESLKRFEEVWVSLMRRGEALRALEEALNGHTPAELREQIRNDNVTRGDLLWQGSSGYCVAMCSARRSAKDITPVLSLQSTKKETAFLSHFLIPIRSLLNSAVLEESEKFGTNHENALREMLSEISMSFLKNDRSQ